MENSRYTPKRSNNSSPTVCGVYVKPEILMGLSGITVMKNKYGENKNREN